RRDVPHRTWLHRRPLRKSVRYGLQHRDRDGAVRRDAVAIHHGPVGQSVRDAWLLRNRPRRPVTSRIVPHHIDAQAPIISFDIMTLSQTWLAATRAVLDDIENTQLPAIRQAAELMADSIAADRWVHTFGCGHATIPVEEMYPRIGGFVGFHPMVELPLTFFTRVTGEMGIHQFLFLERAEGYGNAIMKSYTFDKRDTMWIFSHTGINNVNIDIALRARELGMKVVATGSASQVAVSRHASGRTLFEI